MVEYYSILWVYENLLVGYLVNMSSFYEHMSTSLYGTIRFVLNKYVKIHVLSVCLNKITKLFPKWRKHSGGNELDFLLTISCQPLKVF